MSSKFKILSIDGGGLKGLIPLQVIKEIERITKQPIHETFDLIAGTSTGGLLTCALLLQEHSIEANKRKYTLEQIENIYLEKGKIIFPRYNHFKGLYMHTRKWIRPMYFSENYEKVLNEYFADYRITSCLKPIFITSYDIHRNIPIFFTRREANRLYENNARLVDICKATSAAPTYFPTHTFIYNGESIICIDGGLIMNNPALGALIEVLSNNAYVHYKIGGIKKPEFKDIMVLSLGTGISSKLFQSQSAKNWGRLQWIKKVIDISMDAPVTIVHDQLDTIFNSMGLEKNYLRINVEIDKKYAEMDDSREETLNHYLHKARSRIKNDKTLKANLKDFFEECGFVIHNEEEEEKIPKA